MERPKLRRGPPSSNSGENDDEGSISSNVSWDELGDALNIGRCQSLSSHSTHSYGNRSFERGHQSLPTIYATGKSTRNLALDGSNRSSLDDSNRFDEFEEIPPCASAAVALGARQSSMSSNTSEEFVPRILDPHCNGNGPTKLNHSLRSQEQAVESWDDLQDEIATALRQSMMDNNDFDNSDAQYDKQSPIAEEQQEQGGGAWNCPACTFLNEDPLHLVCIVCGTAKVAQNLSSSPASALNNNSSATAAPLRGSLTSLTSSLRGSFSGGNKNSIRHVDYSDDTNFRSSFSSQKSHRRSNSGGNGRNDEDLIASTGSHSSRGGGVRRRGVRRGAEGQRGGKDSLNSSVKSDALSSRERDSFGSFDSKDYQLHSFKPRGGGRRGDNHKLHRSASGPPQSCSVSSHRSSGVSSHRSSRRRGDRDRDDTSRKSGRRRNGSKKVDYRRSTSMMEYDGNNSYEDSYDSGDGVEGVRSIGGKIDANSLNTESDCSDLSDDEETLYRDDRTERTMRTIKTLRVPEGEVTIIYTDVQGSTSLWEADPLAMKKATDIHDSIIRKCYADHGGYEITTEGDAFNLAFQHPADAIGFALKAQLSLYRAKWPEGILNHPDGCDNEKKKFRGFRVRFGMHHGPTTSDVHETTGRTIYQGEAVDIAKAIEKMSHGGQILTTVETWRTVSGMAEQFLGSPQVMDCGEHLCYDPKKAESAGAKKKAKRIFSKRILQLVPNSLSYDFFAARGGQEVKEGETPPRVCGRVFPPLLSHGQLSTSFLNAPYIGNRVAMVFVYTDKMESVTDKERKKNFKILAKYVRSHLMRLSPPGYECQEDKGSWMLAFDRIENGIKFGLDLKEDVLKNSELFGDVDKERAFRVGIHWGPFLSMGPHTVSGHADYFGPIVNRAARVAAQCEPGQVCVGVPMGDGEEPPDPGPSVDVDVLGVKQLKGISIEMAIFACRKKGKK
mmetsp:Transcript_11959/g.22163  ORF Transcript_11959/g.22163 Transcript_11959/m.22163 type:complete len:951 (-) Transcript_11959:434-3286(-)